MKPVWRTLGRMLALLALSTLALQLYFLGRIALMAVVDPQSTTFQRSEAWRLLTHTGQVSWRQEWSDYTDISDHLKRAVIASEDATFPEHSGVDWEALKKAWERNQKARERAEKTNARLAARAATRRAASSPTAAPVQPKIVGASTITQQLAKNLFLGSERSLVRKGQELVITLMLETVLDKRRLFEIYLNNVEWGEGVFGAQAAAQHYFRVPASRLTPRQAARLAVMLPAPKRFEKRPHSAYVAGRTGTIAARMGQVSLP